MTWYDGGGPPDPARDRADARARLRAAAGRAGAGEDDPGAPAAAAVGRGSASDGGPLAAGGPSADEGLLAAAGLLADEGLLADGSAAAGRPPLLTGLRWQVPPRTAAVALLVLALVGGAVALRAVAVRPAGDPVAIEEPLVGPSPSAAAPAEPAEEPTVWVHVVGQVAAPGVVALPAGARVGEAVAAAGGPLPGADLTALNLAAVVPDGAQVRVPAPGEEPPPEAAGGVTVDGGGGAAGTVDVNRATAAELETLPGIGPVLAERVVAWRTEHGPFPDVAHLQDVPGIGPALMARLADLVRV